MLSKICFVTWRIITVQNKFGITSRNSLGQWIFVKPINLKLSFKSQDGWLWWCWGIYCKVQDLKADTITFDDNAKTISKYVSIILNNFSLAFKSFAIIFYSIPLFIKGYITPSLEDFFGNLIEQQVTLRNMGELTPWDQAYPKATSIPLWAWG